MISNTVLQTLEKTVFTGRLGHLRHQRSRLNDHALSLHLYLLHPGAHMQHHAGISSVTDQQIAAVSQNQARLLHHLQIPLKMGELLHTLEGRYPRWQIWSR